MNRIITAAMAATILAAPAMADAPGYFKIPGTDTTMKIYGNATLDTAWDGKGTGVAGPDAGLGSASATSDDNSPSNQWKMTAATMTRFGFTTTTPSSFGDVVVKVEGDFSSTSKKWNGTKNVNDKTGLFRLRHAFGQFGGWTIGQTDSTFIDPDGSPDYLDWDGMLADWYGSGRVPQVRYTFNLNKQAALKFAMEQDKTGSADSKFPGSLVGAFSYADSWGHVYVAAGYQKYVPDWTWGGSNPSKTTLSWTLSGSVNIGKDALVARIAKGDGFYGAGLQDTVVTNLGNGDLDVIKALQWDLGFTHNWTDNVRSNLIFSQVRYSKDENLGMTGNAFHTYNQITVNTIAMLAKNIQFGAEYVYGNAKTFDADTIVNPDGSTTDKVKENKLRLQMRFNFF